MTCVSPLGHEIAEKKIFLPSTIPVPWPVVYMGSNKEAVRDELKGKKKKRISWDL